MQRLSQKNLTNILGKVADKNYHISKENYDRELIKPGIVHFGVGNFHRCHQAVYIDKLLGQGDLEWGIIGVSMRSSKIRDALKPQDFLYTEATLGSQIEFRIIGSILDILVAPEDPVAVIDQLADTNIKLVTTTITEKGYCLSSGQIDVDHPDIVADKNNLERPRSIYGYIAAALIQRYKDEAVPLSVICCDNIQSGGVTLREGVDMLLELHAKDILGWVEKNVSFASSMVDRVSPATDQSLKQLVNSALEFDDAWPVSAEPFTLWVIEDKFAGVRPVLDQVGALFTDDILLYELMKLRLLNAGHSIIAVLGYLDKREMIHQALKQPYILKFVQKALYENLLPVTDIPEDCQGEDYISDVIQRFHNGGTPYRAQQVNSDSSQKIRLRWFPSIDNALARNSNTKLISFFVAAWVVYIEKALSAGELKDPLSDKFSVEYQNDMETIHHFLVVAGADSFNFITSAGFMRDVLDTYKILKQSDIKTALNLFLAKPREVNHA